MGKVRQEGDVPNQDEKTLYNENFKTLKNQEVVTNAFKIPTEASDSLSSRPA